MTKQDHARVSAITVTIGNVHFETLEGPHDYLVPEEAMKLVEYDLEDEFPKAKIRVFLDTEQYGDDLTIEVLPSNDEDQGDFNAARAQLEDQVRYTMMDAIGRVVRSFIRTTKEEEEARMRESAEIAAYLERTS